MDIALIFLAQFVLSLIAVGLLARWYAVPWLAGKSLEVALMILIAPHAFRHIGLAFLVPALNQPGMPLEFAASAAYGDLLSGILALVTLVALRRHWAMAMPLVWVFSIVGLADLANALRQDEAILYMGATWFIPTFVVPVLLVTHAMVIMRLVSNGLVRNGLVRNAKGFGFAGVSEAAR